MRNVRNYETGNSFDPFIIGADLVSELGYADNMVLFANNANGCIALKPICQKAHQKSKSCLN